MRLLNHGPYEPILRGKTPGRCYLNEMAAGLDFGYPLLDVGGGHDNGYHRYAETDLDRVVSLNIPREEETDDVDVFADAEGLFPFHDGSFQTVFAFNVLEHLSEYSTTIDECHRVLKEGGDCFVGIPFIHRIHGDPEDYVRLTAEAIKTEFEAFSEVEIHALDEGPVSAAVSILFPVLQNDVFQYVTWRVGNSIDALIARYASLTGRDGVFDGKHPLFYFVHAKK